MQVSILIIKYNSKKTIIRCKKLQKIVFEILNLLSNTNCICDNMGTSYYCWCTSYHTGYTGYHI